MVGNAKTCEGRNWLAKALVALAVVALLSSIFFPYWRLKVVAPQYPKGLKITIFLNRIEGDVQEIDTLNHYIGMRPLKEGAQTERKLAIIGVGILILSAVGSLFIKNNWSAIFLFPILLFPFIFAGDLYLWLRDFGLHLNPHAPLSSSIKPFIPPLFGHGKIAQFHATADFCRGYYMAVAAACFVLIIFVTNFLKRSNNKPIARALGIFLIMSAFTAKPVFAETHTIDTNSKDSLQSVINEMQAGDTLIVKAGRYEGPVRVTKSIQMIGENFPVIDGGGKGTVVRLDAPNILFRGFVVRASGNLLAPEDSGLVASAENILIENNRFEDVLFGIYLHQARGSKAIRNVLRGKPLDMARRGDLIRVWYSNDSVLEANQTFGGRDAVIWYSKNMQVLSNEFRDGRYGLHFMYCQNAMVKGNHLIHNSVGAYLMYSADLMLDGNVFSDNRGPSGYGIGFKDMERAQMENNAVAGNRVGLFMDGTSKGLFHHNLIAYNDIGAQVFPTAKDNHFDHNNFIDNSEQVTLDGQSVWTVNDWNGNYWSDYRGFDLNHDGTGDIPYRPMKLFERLIDHDHELKIFFASPAVQAIDFAASTFPIFAPSPKLTDAKPFMNPVTLPIHLENRPSPRAWGMMSIFLLSPLIGFLKSMPKAASKRESVKLPPKEGVVIQISHVTKQFKHVTALSDFSLTVSKGQTVALWGPNGAGKTTLLRCLLGILSFDGDIMVEDLDVKKNGKKVRREIGYVPQEIRLHPDQTVLETIHFYARLRGVSTERAEQLLLEWGLAPEKRQLAQNLSGGMKQKLALAIALLSDPPILFLDEPTSNLDAATRSEFEASLDRLKGAGKTLLFCSHRLSEIRRIADRMVVMETGIKKSDTDLTDSLVRSRMKEVIP